MLSHLTHQQNFHQLWLRCQFQYPMRHHWLLMWFRFLLDQRYCCLQLFRWFLLRLLLTLPHQLHKLQWLPFLRLCMF
jgi:hypothetical protein